VETLEGRRLLATASEVSLQGLITGFAYGMASASDGSLWFAETGVNKVGRFNPATGSVQEFTVPQAITGLQQLFRGPDGNVWFLANYTRVIGELTPTGLALTKFELGSSGVIPNTVTTGPDGNVWVTDSVNVAIDRILPNGTIQTFPVPPVTTAGGTSVAIIPEDIAAGPDGNVWFDSGGSGYVGRITPGGQITEFAIGSTSAVTGITPAADGNVWFASYGGSFVGRITMAGAVSLFTVNGGLGHPTGIGPGPGGTVAFGDGPAVGLVSPNGSVSETVFTNLTGGYVSTTALDTSGRLWFNEQAPGSGPSRVLGQFVTPPPPSQTIQIVSVPGVSQSGVLNGGAVAVFAYGAGTAPASAFTGVIGYGDGSSAIVPVFLNTQTHAYVIGSAAHVYAKPGTYTVSVAALSQSLGLSPAYTTFQVTVTGPARAAVSAALRVDALPGAAAAVTGLGGAIASFTEGTGSAPAGAFTAVIDYGDGTSTLAPVVQDPATGRYFIVSARHVYARRGTYTVAVGALSNPLGLAPSATAFTVTV
jgi:virginiamycin B lyase